MPEFFSLYIGKLFITQCASELWMFVVFHIATIQIITYYKVANKPILQLIKDERTAQFYNHRVETEKKYASGTDGHGGRVHEIEITDTAEITSWH